MTYGKNQGGRPTDYKPEFCAKVIEWGKQGKSKAWMAAELDVTRQTLENWSKAYPEFLDAITRGIEKSQQWWEDAGQGGLTMPGFGASVWSRSMAARFPADWREQKDHSVTGANGGPIQMQVEKVIREVVRPDASNTDG